MSGYTPNKDPNFWRNDNFKTAEANCGSYAFDVIEWYWPYNHDESYGDDIIESWNYSGCTFGEALADSTNQHLQYILDNFSNVRVIHNFNEVAADERIILYREGIFCGSYAADLGDECHYRDDEDGCGWEWDFHFIWRDANGIWHEKMGGGFIKEIDSPSLNEPWTYWSLAYQGPIIMLAKKETKYAA